MQLDILAFAAHPDDVELSCSGTIMKQIALGCKVGIVDLTRGELGTRGTAKIRAKEVEAASKIMGVHARENLGLRDGFIQNAEEHQLAVIKMIRKYRPAIVLANAKYDRHPDHGKTAELVRDACFLSGLTKIETKLKGTKQDAFRPKVVYHYQQALNQQADFVVDISDFFEKKMECIRAFKSQFHNPSSKEKNTFISTLEFLEFVKSRDIYYGVPIGAKYAEAFSVNRVIGLNDITQLL